MSGNEEYETFDSMVEWEFHINSIIPIIGCIVTVILASHSCYHSKCKKQTTNNRKSAHVKQKYSKHTNNAWIVVYTAMLFSYITYGVEFWWLRIYPATNGWLFCKGLTPFLFLSQSLTQFVVMLYFTVRLDTSFSGSVLAFAKWKIWLMRCIGGLAAFFPTILSLPLTYGVPFSLKTQSTTDSDAWLCRNAVKWNLFFPFLFLFCGIGTMALNFLNWYCFMNRLSAFVRLRLQNDDSFIKFYSSKHIPGISEYETSFESSTHKMSVIESGTSNGYTSNGRQSIDISIQPPHTPNTPNSHNTHHIPSHLPSHSNQLSEERERKSSKIKKAGKMTLEKIKKHKEKKERRKARRAKQQLLIYELIKKQTILSGIVAISDAATWLPSIIIDGSELILINTMIGIICVYLSFNFSKQYFDFCCKRFMDHCTCIEDHIEKKLAKEMGLDMNEGNEEQEIHQFNDHNDIQLNDRKINRRITEFENIEEHNQSPVSPVVERTDTVPL